MPAGKFNIEFLELYKSVDRFIKDAFRSSEGITTYIQEMESYNSRGAYRIKSWTQDYDMLKHVRWVRNQLVHEVGYDSDLCEDRDYAFIKDFYDRLFSGNDPIAVLNRSMSVESKSKNKKAHVSANNNQFKDSYQEQRREPKKLSFWQRLQKFLFEDEWL